MIAVGAVGLLAFGLIQAANRWSPASGVRMTLYSLDPDQTPALPGPVEYGMAKTIGRAEVREAERQAVLLSSVLAAIDEHGQGALCFLPRHALRVSDAFGTTTYVLCFECRWVEIHSELAGKPRTVRMVALRTEPQKLFEEEVQRLGLPRPPDVGAPSRVPGHD